MVCENWFLKIQHLYNIASSCIFIILVGAFVTNFTTDTSTTATQTATGTVKLNCFAEGNPLPRLTISRRQNKLVEATVNNTKSLSLSIPNVKCEHIDEYVCDADNGVATPRDVSKTFRLFINCEVIFICTLKSVRCNVWPCLWLSLWYVN